MKILYGIQGTGNGHISRARILARHLEKTNADVTYLFSGRERDDFFDMEIFGDFICLRGFTFYSTNGAVSYKKTIFNNNIFHFLSDVMSLDITGYDLIITDFEPVSAWAGKLRGKKIIGVGHQYAFNHNIPRAGDNALTRSIMRYFSPATISIGLHWHHFGNQEVLPPIIDTEHTLPTSKSIDSKSGKKIYWFTYLLKTKMSYKRYCKTLLIIASLFTHHKILTKILTILLYEKLASMVLRAILPQAMALFAIQDLN